MIESLIGPLPVPGAVVAGGAPAPFEFDAIWAETRGDPRICIALLDGPVDLTHPSFRQARLTAHRTLAAAGAESGPATAHGTHVASLIFGGHDGPVAGVAPDCSGLILPVFADGPEGALVVCSQVDLARAILQALELGAHVINISGGQFSQDGEPDPLLAKAIAACSERNVLVVAAAGNNGCDCLHVPAAINSVLPVGATDHRGEPLDVSNWGALYQSRGLVAPGENILGAQPGGGVSARTGTSFAAPLVSGVAALLLSAQLARHERADPNAVRRALIASAVPCDPDRGSDCRRFLAGRLNPSGAFNLIVEGGVNMSEVNLAEPAKAAVAASATAPEQRPQAHPAAATASRTVSPTQPEAAVSASEALLPGTPADAPKPPAAGRQTAPPSVTPSDCGCGGGAACTCGTGQAPQLVYALGKLGHDFGTEARRDTFTQAMPGTAPNPHDQGQIAEYLRANPFEAEALIWTLNLDATPIYAIVPNGPFAATAYERLRTAFEGQLHRGVELVSVPGVIAGSVTLLSGQVVPAVVPAIRGMFSWATGPLIESVIGARPKAGAERSAYERRLAGLNNFLSRVYYDLRNLGVTAQERALNYSATNAFQVAQVMESASQGDLELDTINVRKSPVCRPDSDCYDIEIGFFDPRNVNVATKVYRFTVDVSDVMPVTIGEVRAWSKRA